MEVRIIKRYPNRRLYDTVTSQYITLNEIKALVISQTNFKIVDHETNDDLTNYILLQIISEQEVGGVPIFTTDFLKNIIRFYGNPLQNMMSEMLEKWFANFSKSTVSQDEGNNPLAWFQDATKENLALWQNSLSSYFKNNVTKTKTKKKKKS